MKAVCLKSISGIEFTAIKVIIIESCIKVLLYEFHFVGNHSLQTHTTAKT